MGKAWIVALILAGVGFFPLLGIPGAVLFMSAWPTTNLIFGPLAYQTWEANLGDSAWPLALLISITWPFLIPLGFYSVSRLFPARAFFSPIKFSVFLLILGCGCVILGQTTVILMGAKRLSKEELVHASVVDGDLETFKRFYDKDDLGKMSPDPLREAIFTRQTEIALYLIGQRSDLTRYNPPSVENSGQFATPLHTAVRTGSPKIVRALLSAQVDPNYKDGSGLTALHSISWDPEGNGEVIDILAEYKADFNAADAHGDTPLIRLVQLQMWDQMHVYAKKMVEAGADINHRNNDGWSALDYARHHEHVRTVDYLERATSK